MKETRCYVLKWQTYLLPEEAYEELRSIQNMLMGLARITYGEQNDTDGNAMLMVSRAELRCLFQQVSVLIGKALEEVIREQRKGGENWMWQ